MMSYYHLYKVYFKCTEFLQGFLLNSLLKERFLIGWKFLGGPGWSRHTVTKLF